MRGGHYLYLRYCRLDRRARKNNNKNAMSYMNLPTCRGASHSGIIIICYTQVPSKPTCLSRSRYPRNNNNHSIFLSAHNAAWGSFPIRGQTGRTHLDAS